MKHDYFVRAPGNYDVDEASNETALHSFDESKTQQQFKEEVDINTIVRRFGLTGEMPSDIRVPQYGDFSNVVDYQSALNAVIAADESFMSMPAEVRSRFANDPQKLLEFLAVDSNRDEAIKLGLVTKPPEVTRDAVMAIDELAARFPVVGK